MRENIALSIENIDKSHNVELQSIELERSSREFDYAAGRLKRKMCIRKWKWITLLVVIILIVLLIIIIASVFAHK